MNETLKQLAVEAYRLASWANTCNAGSNPAAWVEVLHLRAKAVADLCEALPGDLDPRTNQIVQWENARPHAGAMPASPQIISDSPRL